MSETTADEANRRFALAPRHCPRHRLSSIAEENDDITNEARPLEREPVERDLRDQLRKLGTGQEFPEEPEDEWKRVPSHTHVY